MLIEFALVKRDLPVRNFFSQRLPLKMQRSACPFSAQRWANFAILFFIQLFASSHPAIASAPANTESEPGSELNRPIKDKWAVVIGISKFADPAIPRLKYPAKDAQDFYNFLLGSGHFARDHVLLLRDQDATKVRILDAFGDGWLPRRVMKDDLVVIFISSHGSPADVAGENFVIAYDSDPQHTYATGIRLQDLATEVTKRTGCDRLIVLLDACHSGSAVTEQKGLQRASTNFNLEAITGTGQLVISSSKPEEVSWESKRYPNGVFTHRLIESLQVNGEATTVLDAYKNLRDSVEQEVRFDRITDQTPMMLSRWKGQDLALCAPPAEPRKVLEELPAEHSEFAGEMAIGRQEANGSGSGSGSASASTATRSTSASHSKSSSEIEVSSHGNGKADSLLSPAMMTASWTDKQADNTLEAETRLLSGDDLRGLSSKELLYLYNEAYARHGRGFISPDIQQYFNGKSWYRIDPDYHWRANDPKVIARKGQLDDSLIINAKRTPKQWQNMMLIKKEMERR